MFAPCSANVRATSSSSRGRSHEATAIWTRNDFVPSPFHSTGVNRSSVPPQRLHVRAVAAVDRDPLAERDVADDRVARHRRAALREPDEHVLDALDDDADLGARDGAARLRRLRDDRRLLGDLVGLQALDHLVDDRAGLQLPRAEREVEVLGLLEAASRGSPGRAPPSRAASRRAGSAASAPARAPRGPSPPGPRASRASTTGGSCCAPASSSRATASRATARGPASRSGSRRSRRSAAGSAAGRCGR